MSAPGAVELYGHTRVAFRVASIEVTAALGLLAFSLIGAAGCADDGATTAEVAALGNGRDCTASVTTAAPSDGLIADFADPDGALATGQVVAFPAGSPSAPVFETANGTLHITQSALPTSMPQYTNVLLGFDGCVDASAFTGVQYSIRGSFSGCSVQYATADVEHQPAISGAPQATGMPESYQPLVTIPSYAIAPGFVPRVPFSGGTFGGSPETPIDPTKLIFLMWQFTIEPATAQAPPCLADIVIDDVRFY